MIKVTCKNSGFWFLFCSVGHLFLSLSFFKISDAFENETAKKVKLQNILSQLRKCVDHPYLFDGETVPFPPTLFLGNVSVAKSYQNSSK